MQNLNQKELFNEIIAVVGDKNFIQNPASIKSYARGYRFGFGKALAVVLPHSLYDLWQSLEILVKHDVIVIMQAANTGLTGGSTPDGDDYDRDVVIVNTMHITENQIQLIDNAKQVVCLPGSTLNRLEKMLSVHNREPHSVIGSSCIGASVLGGVCNNSGGMLVQRGPAYTKMALFAQISADGRLELINHLGINLGETPQQILTNLQQAKYTDADIISSDVGHDHNYCNHVRDVEAETPARFNADPNRLYEASGCAGKVIVFALRLDTFEKVKTKKSFYIGTNNSHHLALIRKHVLRDFKQLPVSGEYMHRTAFDMADKYAKDTFMIVKHLGTDRLPALFEFKKKFDRAVENIKFFPKNPSDKLMQFISKLLPDHLPKELRLYRDKYEHHLNIVMSDAGIDECRQYLTEFFNTNEGEFIECDEKLAAAAALHRFSVGNAPIRYNAVHDKTVGSIIALDLALRRNDEEFFETLPAEIEEKIIDRVYYGHFLCNVFHQDYLIKKDVDPHALESKMQQILDTRGAQYPAEHNVGHLYEAKIDLRDFYKKLDPTNSLNPGIGKTSKLKNWQ